MIHKAPTIDGYESITAANTGITFRGIRPSALGAPGLLGLAQVAKPGTVSRNCSTKSSTDVSHPRSHEEGVIAESQRNQRTGAVDKTEAILDLTIGSPRRLSVIERLLKHLSEQYVYPDVAEKMETAIRKNLKNGEPDGITSAIVNAETLEAHLQEVSQDQYLWVNFSFVPYPRGEPMLRLPHPEATKTLDVIKQKVIRTEQAVVADVPLSYAVFRYEGGAPRGNVTGNAK